jgi:two-component system, OmpR family, sensor histidine kinase MtrB
MRGELKSNTLVRKAAETGRPDGWNERDHELRAALYGMEALARGLCEHRDQLPSGQVDELLKSLVAEIRRVRALVAGRVGRPRTFDLAEAIGPVVSCARASGLDVRCAVPAGIEVMGRRNCTAQVVLALLDNARKHAPGSAVTLKIGELDGAVALFVDDRGPGIPAALRERVFERGARGDDTSGSGLGLCVAKRLMAEQSGTVECRSRRGGGASFVLRFSVPADR